MNKMKVLAVLSVFSWPALGAIEITDNFSISGFGSTSWTKSDNQELLMVHRNITDESCYDCDTTLGIQLDYFRNAFKASVQVVKRPQDHWDEPEFEWAYVGYEWQELEFKAGRLRLPLFLASEYYYVGQAYSSARPASEVYDSVLGITAYNGLSASWHYEVSDSLIALVTPFVGLKDTNDIQYNQQTEFKFESSRLLGLDLNLFGDGYRWHFAYISAYYDQTLTLYDVVQSLPSGGSVTIPKLVTETTDQNIELWSLGLEYEFGQSTLRAEGQINDLSSSFYATGEHHFGRITPYITYGIELDQSEHKESDSYLIGARYDLLDNLSLNAEWQYFEVSKSNGPFVTAPIGTTPDDTDAHLYTLMINFVF